MFIFFDIEIIWMWIERDKCNRMINDMPRGKWMFCQRENVWNENRSGKCFTHTRAHLHTARNEQMENDKDEKNKIKESGRIAPKRSKRKRIRSELLKFANENEKETKAQAIEDRKSSLALQCDAMPKRKACEWRKKNELKKETEARKEVLLSMWTVAFLTFYHSLFAFFSSLISENSVKMSFFVNARLVPRRLFFSYSFLHHFQFLSLVFACPFAMFSSEFFPISHFFSLAVAVSILLKRATGPPLLRSLYFSLIPLIATCVA